LLAAAASPTALPGALVGLGVGSAAGIGSLDSIGGATSSPAAGAHSSRSNSIRPASPSPSLASSDRGGGVGGEESAERYDEWIS